MSLLLHLKSILPPHGCGGFSAAVDFGVTLVSHRATVLHVFTADCLRESHNRFSVLMKTAKSTNDFTLELYAIFC